MSYTDLSNIIKHIINSHDKTRDGNLDVYLANEIVKRQDINHKRYNIQQMHLDLTTKFEEGKKLIKEEEYALIKTCRHWDVSFYGDASGGNNSYYRCADCGLESSKMERGRRI